ncbi:MAG: LemA family protein [Clostridia bacterium]|nr:LemA family protein [Clostridia bacterium]
MTTGAIIGIVAGVIVVLLIIWFVSTMNALIQKKMTVEEAFSGMDVYLKKRYDLIPNLVNTVKGYAEHERETLDSVISARNNAASANRGDINAAVESEKTLDSAVSRLFAIAENYPNLKADTQFLNLQGELRSVENDIAQSRKYYNGAVKQYNVKVAMFPSSIVAGMTGHKKAAFFEVSDDTQRENVEVKF